MLPSYERTPHTEALCAHLEALERARDPPAGCLPAAAARRSRCTSLAASRPGTSGAARRSASSSRATRPSWPRRTSAELEGTCSIRAGRSPASRVSAESAAVNRWNTTQGGGVIAAGVRGGLTGYGANLLIVDDPVKDREEADSAAIRNSTWAWWTEVATHAADARRGRAARADALARGRPGRAHPGSPERGRVDGAQRSRRSPRRTTRSGVPRARRSGRTGTRRERLEALRSEIGERAFLALYQQRPTLGAGRDLPARVDDRPLRRASRAGA